MVNDGGQLKVTSLNAESSPDLEDSAGLAFKSSGANRNVLNTVK